MSCIKKNREYMKKQAINWNVVPDASGYILRVRRSSTGDSVEKDVGNKVQTELELSEEDDYTVSVLAYDTKRRSEPSQPRVIKVIQLKPLGVPVVVSPDDGTVVELDPVGGPTDIRPAVLKSPPDGHEVNAGSFPLLNLYWDEDPSSRPADGFYVSVMCDGDLVVDREDVVFALGDPAKNSYGFQVEPSHSYEWQVVPYDSAGEAAGCPWWGIVTTDQSQTVFPSVSIGGVASKDGEYDLPVTVERFHNVSRFDMYITYGTTGVDVGDCVGATLNDALPGEATVEDVPYTGWTGGKMMKVSWSQPESHGLDDGSTLLTLHFNRTANVFGFSQVAFYNLLREEGKDMTNFYNGDLLLDYDLAQGIHGKVLSNGWINTALGPDDVPLPINPVNMSPDKGGGTVYKFTEPEKVVTLNWIDGNPPRPLGYKVSVKEDGELIVDKQETSESQLGVNVKPDRNYEFQVLPFNGNGTLSNDVWYHFKTKTLVIYDAPVTTVGNVTSDDSTAVVPLTVENFSNVGCCDLELTYDPGVAKCTNVTLGDGIGATFFVGNPTELGMVSLSWILFTPGPDGPIGLDLADGTVMFELHFEKVPGASGTTGISFDNSNQLMCNWYTATSDEFNDSPDEDFYVNGSVTFTDPGVTGVPSSVGIINPIDNMPEVGSVINDTLVVDLKWQPSDAASGYKLYIGTSVDLNEYSDLGNVVSKRMFLDYGTTYYWKIVPYNELGDAEDCPVSSFTTMEELT